MSVLLGTNMESRPPIRNFKRLLKSKRLSLIVACALLNLLSAELGNSAEKQLVMSDATGPPARDLTIAGTNDVDAVRWTNSGALISAASSNLAIIGAVSNTTTAMFHGHISGKTLVASGAVLGSLELKTGVILSGEGIKEGTQIESQMTGKPGGAGTYSLNLLQSVGEETISGSFTFFPTGVSGIGYNKAAGNTVFGVYGEAHCNATGVCTNEFDTFNEVADAPSFYPFSRAIGVNDAVPVGISVVANHVEKPFHSAAGIEIGAFDARDSFQFGIALSKIGASRYSYYQDSTSSEGPINGIYLAIPGIGTNLILKTMGALRSDNKVLDVQDAAGMSNAAIKQGGFLYIKAINLGKQEGIDGKLPSASCGDVDSGSNENSFVINITSAVKTCTVRFAKKMGKPPNCVANAYSPGPHLVEIAQVDTGSLSTALFVMSGRVEKNGKLRAQCF